MKHRSLQPWESDDAVVKFPICSAIFQKSEFGIDLKKQLSGQRKTENKSNGKGR
jgi:hypothetical protein